MSKYTNLIDTDIIKPRYCTSDGIGYVQLVDVMPARVEKGKTADSEIAASARVSYGKGTKSISDDATLIRYLMRHEHMSPFEMCELKLVMKLPVFLARQFIRHRTASVNEVSARYSEVPDEYWQPDAWRVQSSTNKQGSGGAIQWDTANDSEHDSVQEYHERLSSGICREQARACLPQSMYTQWVWKCDLRNVLHFLKLRMHQNAQKEARDYANEVAYFVAKLFPVTWKAFRDYHLNAITLTGFDLECIRKGEVPADANKREVTELMAKLERAGLHVRGNEQEITPPANWRLSQ